MIIFTFCVYALGVFFLFWLYSMFGSSTLNVTILIVITAFLVIFTIGVFLEIREDASILTNAIVFLYFLYLACSAMSNSPDNTANPFVNSETNTLWEIFMGIFFYALTLLTITIVLNIKDKQTDSGFIGVTFSDDPETPAEEI